MHILQAMSDSAIAGLRIIYLVMVFLLFLVYVLILRWIFWIEKRERNQRAQIFLLMQLWKKQGASDEEIQLFRQSFKVK